MAFVNALAAEISSLESELEKDPHFVKLRELQRLKNLYSDNRTPSGPAPIVSNVSNARTARAPRQSSPASTARQKAIEYAKQYVSGKPHPIKTKEIFAHLQFNLIEIGGKSPESNLSAMLHNHPDFESHGREGWKLKENEAPSGNPEGASETEG